MKHEEIDITVKNNEKLMLQALSSYYPYDVVLHFDDAVDEDDQILYSLRENGGRVLVNDAYYLLEVKPYLRPLDSMTEEEKKKFDDFCVIDEFIFKGDTEIGHKNQAIIMSEGIDYLNSIHVDYRGLILKCLAIEVTKENNPYEKIKL